MGTNIDFPSPSPSALAAPGKSIQILKKGGRMRRKLLLCWRDENLLVYYECGYVILILILIFLVGFVVTLL